MIKDLNVRPETVKPLEENIGGNSLTLVLTMIFLDMTPKAQATNQTQTSEMISN